MIRNTGRMSGSEVVQVYIGKPGSAVERAVKELKGFSKVTLGPGTASTVEIPIPVSDLAYYDEQESRWIVERGDYTVHTGNSSDNISGQLLIRIE